jgi:hypothetical protein
MGSACDAGMYDFLTKELGFKETWCVIGFWDLGN